MEGNSFMGSGFPFGGAYSSAWAPVTESYRSGGFNGTNVIYPGSGGWEVQDHGRQGWVHHEHSS